MPHDSTSLLQLPHCIDEIAPLGLGVLSAESQPGQEGLIRGCVLPGEIGEESTTAAHLEHEAIPRLMVVAVVPQVLRDLPDLVGEKRYLDFAGTSIGGVRLIFAYNLLNLLLVQPYLASFASLSSLSAIIAPTPREGKRLPLSPRVFRLSTLPRKDHQVPIPQSYSSPIEGKRIILSPLTGER
jgi:hypothetical protein